MTIAGKGGRPIGLAKTGGRQKGTPNRATLTLKEKLAAMGCEPLVEIAKMGMNEKNEIEIRERCFADIAPYLHPKLKPVDVSSDESLVINVLTKFDPGSSNGGYPNDSGA